MWGDAPWPQSRPWPTDWTENTMEARMPALDPTQTVSAAFMWGAVVTMGAAAVAAGGMLAVAKWFGGAR